jgi:hypothetical protein
VTALIGLEDLREKDPESHERGEQAVAEGHRLVAEGLLDGLPIEEVGEGEFGATVQLLPQLRDLARPWGRCSMVHGWPPGS